MKFVCIAYPELEVYLPNEDRYVKFHQGSYDTNDSAEIIVLKKAANVSTPAVKQIAKAKAQPGGVMRLPPIGKSKPKTLGKSAVTVADLEKAGFGTAPTTVPEEAPHAEGD